jgi:hypothetical protein
VRPHARARSSKSLKKPRRSEVSLLKDGALLDVGAGIALIPLEMVDIAEINEMAGVDGVGDGTDGGLGEAAGPNVDL